MPKNARSTVTAARYKIVGSITRGYWIFANEENVCTSLHFTKMWDAITARNNLNNGTWKLHPSFVADES